jgi:hypothetical protein
MLDVPGERALRVAVMGQHLVGMDPRDRTPPKDDRERGADQPRAPRAFRILRRAVGSHVSSALPRAEPNEKKLSSASTVTDWLRSCLCKA